MQVKLSDAWYDALKFVAQILLPAAGALYFALADIWGLPKAQEVVGSITAIDAFLGVLLGINSAAYRKNGDGVHGLILMKEGEDSTNYSLELNDGLEILKPGKDVTFRVTEG